MRGGGFTQEGGETSGEDRGMQMHAGMLVSCKLQKMSASLSPAF